MNKVKKNDMITQRLIKISLLSSPVMALYSIAPIYIFKALLFTQLLQVLAGLTTITLMFWTINILIYHYIRTPGQVVKVLTAYFFGIVLISLIAILPKPVNSPVLQNMVYPYLSGIAINTIIIIIINAIESDRQKLETEREKQQLLVKNIETRNLLLMQQLQPHFLFNTLSTLKSLINTNKEQAELYIVQLSEFLRFSMQSHNTAHVTLQDELTFAKNYFSLQNVRFGEAILLKINVHDELLSHRIPVCGIQLLIENAIKHNTFSKKKPLEITIESNNSVVSVSNNKTESVDNAGTGLGLANLNERYKQIIGKDIEIVSNEHQFKVYLTLLEK